MDNAIENILLILRDSEKIRQENLERIFTVYGCLEPLENLPNKLFKYREPCKHAKIKDVFNNDLCEDCSDDYRVYLFKYEISDDMGLAYDFAIAVDTEPEKEEEKIPYSEYIKLEKRLEKLEERFNKDEEIKKVVKEVKTVLNQYSPPSHLTSKIYVDGGHGKYSGSEGFARVTDDKGKDMLPYFENFYSDIKYRDVDLPIGRSRVLISKFSDVSKQQNNGAELIALLVALRIACKHKIIKEICSDSQVIISWSNGRLTPKTKKTIDSKKLQYINELVNLRTEFEKMGGKVVKISGDENMSDLGYH